MGWKRLTGGLTSIVHRLTVERNGGREEYVLRWWVPGSQWEQWIARAVPLETAVLTKLKGSDIPAPRVMARLDHGRSIRRSRRAHDAFAWEGVLDASRSRTLAAADGTDARAHPCSRPRRQTVRVPGRRPTAPLIGSSRALKTLRERIERVGDRTGLSRGRSSGDLDRGERPTEQLVPVPSKGRRRSRRGQYTDASVTRV